MNGYYLSADVDQYHIALTRQEGYRVVKEMISHSINLLMFICVEETHVFVFVETGDAEFRAPEQRESGRRVHMGPVGLRHSKNILPYCTGQNHFSLYLPL